MRRAIRRLLTTLVVLVLLLGGAAWWLLSYIAPDERLDMRYEPIDVKAKVLDTAQQLKPELVLTESDITHLIKKHLQDKYGGGEGGAPMELAKDVRLDGADFQLEEGRLKARLNVTYKERIPAALDAVYALEWQPPNIALRPQSLTLKEIGLPLGLLEPVVVPLDLPLQDVVTVSDVQFQQDRVKILFKLQLGL
ncbi:hypothetical protein [Paenibacillus arenilitoris]|uniref:Uncharacterized protein n=1 Tax=Paenibacillus arenilitoris TaxID=2772299 RepID=A0A927CSE7_9BACL|nr:hypothetical protein [Paenibacillus arenilitoris]MBD2872889.1 hypothetical protein [Paenibacillus arenilitoris]